MKELEFPIIPTKVESLSRTFDLKDPRERGQYFEAKAGVEIREIKRFLERNTFLAYLVGKKNSGKGTYAKMFSEVFGGERFTHISVGDLVRETHQNWGEFAKSAQFARLKSLYRGYIPFDDAAGAFVGKSTQKLLPTEFVLALLKLHFTRRQRK